LATRPLPACLPTRLPTRLPLPHAIDSIVMRESS
jgi:hypothetical protein